MISATNHFYYYENNLIEDASNFRTTSPKGLRAIVEDFIKRSKTAAYDPVIYLKIWNEASLDETSRSAIEFIKQKKYRRVNLKEVEKKLITLTEAQ